MVKSLEKLMEGFFESRWIHTFTNTRRGYYLLLAFSPSMVWALFFLTPMYWPEAPISDATRIEIGSLALLGLLAAIIGFLYHEAWGHVENRRQRDGLLEVTELALETLADRINALGKARMRLKTDDPKERSTAEENRNKKIMTKLWAREARQGLVRRIFRLLSILYRDLPSELADHALYIFLNKIYDMEYVKDVVEAKGKGGVAVEYRPFYDKMARVVIHEESILLVFPEFFQDR